MNKEHLTQSHTLTAMRCEETGEVGVVLDATDTSNFYDGDLFVMSDAIGIAHDLTEHAKLADIGTVREEFDALGAIWFVRGSLSDMRRDDVGSAHTPHQHIASDIARMASLAYWHDGSYEWPAQEDCDFEADLSEIIELARHDTLEEFKYSGDEHQGFNLDNYLEHAARGFRHGAARMYEKWSDHNGQYGANSRFWNIVDCLNASICFGHFEEGQVWQVEVDADDLVVITEMTYCALCEDKHTYDELDDEMQCVDCSDQPLWLIQHALRDPDMDNAETVARIEEIMEEHV